MKQGVQGKSFVRTARARMRRSLCAAIFTLALLPVAVTVEAAEAVGDVAPADDAVAALPLLFEFVVVAAAVAVRPSSVQFAKIIHHPLHQLHRA